MKYSYMRERSSKSRKQTLIKIVNIIFSPVTYQYFRTRILMISHDYIHHNLPGYIHKDEKEK